MRAVIESDHFSALQERQSEEQQAAAKRNSALDGVASNA